MYTKNCMLASSKPIHCFSPLSRKLDVGWPRIEDFQLRGHSCVNNVQRCLCHFYTWMRHSKQAATLLLTKRHANFDTSTSAKGYARVYELRMRNCSPWHTLAQARPTMPCIRLVTITLWPEHQIGSDQCRCAPPGAKYRQTSSDSRDRAIIAASLVTSAGGGGE